MKQDGMNRYLSIGILLVGISIGLNHFIQLPDFLYGLGLGFGIALELIGAFAMRLDMRRVREFKQKMLHL